MTVQETKIEKNIHALLTWDIGANINYTWQEMLEHREAAIEALKEVEQYRALGTVEELKEAREKQIPKKPIIKGEELGFNVHCPNCDSYVGYLTEGMNEPEQMEYCSECGQHISREWSK